MEIWRSGGAMQVRGSGGAEGWSFGGMDVGCSRADVEMSRYGDLELGRLVAGLGRGGMWKC